jgi:excisionase family DNA binding protein
MIEACGLANVGLTTGWKLLREGQLIGVKVGRRRLILLASVERLLQTGGA